MFCGKSYVEEFERSHIPQNIKHGYISYELITHIFWKRSLRIKINL